ncbi:cobalamin synthesis protein P47K [Ancylobacter novellus DSM 506]|uniref:Cobalamin synthesis protein P47K n=1 Tax=Ancylobacter novellus (strain ATCC 8093 / DSM 506 / JCM 20403 / CCM 1077 / IAM 12100 / NBRC 12443 / NCIMB 10456) TaxID=639283 RepID=D7A2K0_ANCN5|nr:GTP-binding protein [Ancylobacter novellus]ADH91530.1 cobalamin synthesis protein P47K [Ancylobacter novellus DSM 506]
MNGGDKLSVHVLTGFLGAGKTSLLRRLLALPALGDTAVVINEFGEVGLDHLLLEAVDEDIVLLKSGCVCCTVRGDLKNALVTLMERRRSGEIPAFARIVVETTGIADPAPIVATLTADPMLRHHFRVGNIVTVVDVPNGLSNIDAYPESLRQVAAADRLVVSKADLADTEEIAALEAGLRAVNPTATLVALDEHAVPDPERLLADLHDETARPAEVARWLDAVASTRWRFHAHGTHDVNAHRDIRAFVLRNAQPLAWPRFALWLSMLLNRHGAAILRLKGLLALEGVEGPVVIQGVQHIVHAPLHLKAWPRGVPLTEIVVIARGLDPTLVQRSFEAFNRLRPAGDAAA